MIAPQLIEEPLRSFLGNLQGRNPFQFVLFRNDVFGQNRYAAEKLIHQRHIVRAVWKVAGFTGIERQFAGFRASAKSRRIDRLSEKIIGAKAYVKIQVANARELHQRLRNIDL